MLHSTNNQVISQFKDKSFQAIKLTTQLTKTQVKMYKGHQKN